MVRARNRSGCAQLIELNDVAEAIMDAIQNVSKHSREHHDIEFDEKQVSVAKLVAALAPIGVHPDDAYDMFIAYAELEDDPETYAEHFAFLEYCMD